MEKKNYLPINIGALEAGAEAMLFSTIIPVAARSPAIKRIKANSCSFKASER
jgi:hypothetical protein